MSIPTGITCSSRKRITQNTIIFLWQQHAGQPHIIQACLCRGKPLVHSLRLPGDADLEYLWPGFPGLEFFSIKGCFLSLVTFSLSQLSSPCSSRGTFSWILPGDLWFVPCWGLISGCFWPVKGMSSSWSPVGGGRSRSTRLTSVAAGLVSAGVGDGQVSWVRLVKP